MRLSRHATVCAHSRMQVNVIQGVSFCAEVKWKVTRVSNSVVDFFWHTVCKEQ